jgi:ThiF family
MSRPLVSHSPDLRRLEEEGYDFHIKDNQLVLRVAYATPRCTVESGWLVSELTTAGDRTTCPGSHVVHFVPSVADDVPCDEHGHALEWLIHQRVPVDLGVGLVASCSFSHKPNPTYPDYYEKMTTYADMLLATAQVIDQNAKVRTYPPIATDADESVFCYLDSATSRSRISAVGARLRVPKVVIVGLGGTGSYILDALAKTEIQEIHLYDGDILLTHNAFRAPGAASVDELRSSPKKVDYFKAKSEAIRRGVIAHPEYVDASNIEDLHDASFVFLALDGGPSKSFIVAKLQEFSVPFIDTGMGVYQVRDSLAGIVRTTLSGSDDWTVSDEELDEYDQNIQIVELNMLNAALAVIRWKKTVGFYNDLEHESSSLYTIDGNHLLNETQ